MSYRVEAVTSSRSPAFAQAFAALSAEFGPRGELERREVLERWLDADEGRASEGALVRSYHLLVGRDPEGELAGVRDCHLVVDREARVAVVYLAHVLVLVPHRRTGLARALRLEPLAIADRALRDQPAFELLLAAEMEPADPADPASLVRLVAYGRDGFSAIDPEVFPYFQPDFRELGMDAVERARPLPLLAVVRRRGSEHAETLPKSLARAFQSHLTAVFATHVHPRQLEALSQHTLRRLDAHPGDEVPLLALPRTIDDHARIAALTLTQRHALPAVFSRGPS